MTPGVKRYIRGFNNTVLLVVVMKLYTSDFDLDETARRDQSIKSGPAGAVEPSFGKLSSQTITDAK